MMTQTYSRPHYCGCPTRPYLMENGASASLLFIDQIGEYPMAARLSWQQSVEKAIAALGEMALEMDELIRALDSRQAPDGEDAESKKRSQVMSNLRRFKKRCQWVRHRLSAADDRLSPQLMEQADTLRHGLKSLRKKAAELTSESVA